MFNPAIPPMSVEEPIMGRTVLIIEDDRRISEWVKVYFERAGYTSVAEALNESEVAAVMPSVVSAAREIVEASQS